MVALKRQIGEAGEPCPLPRSRNAVVALKHLLGLSGGGLHRPKQERRGGIETSAGWPGAREALWEAGTPWWH